MKYYNTYYAPSIEVLSRKPDQSLERVTLTKGEGKLTAAEYEIVLRSPVVEAFVRDGYLDFPNCEILGPLHNATKEDRLAREKELFNAEPEEQDIPQDLAELTELVGSQASELADANKRSADLLEANKKMTEDMKALLARVDAIDKKPAVEAKPLPVAAAKPSPTPAPAAPVTPAAVAAPVTPAPATTLPVAAPAPPAE